MFAVVDVETTGGHPSGHSMTEIAIVLHDGLSICDEYVQLLRPDQSIPLSIQTLTGISNEMVAGAPCFSEVAEEIHAFLGDHIFVAHNVNFDLGFVQAAFSRQGIDYNPRRLCSVRYARRIEKGLRSYSLKNLCQQFGIDNEAAHRAWGDARATAQLLEQLLEKDKQAQWQHMIKRNKGEFNLPAHLPAEQYHNLPTSPGVYYFYGADERPIYIGKAKNIKKRVSSHFGGDKETKRSQAFKREIHRIEYEETGSELLAFILEDHEIRHYWPRYNRAQKKQRKKYGVFAYRDQQGFWCLAVNRIQKQQNGFLKEFYAKHQAESWLLEQTKTYDLDPHFCGFTSAYLPDQEREGHNERFQLLLEQVKAQKERFLIRLPGRTPDEWAYLLVDQGQAKAMGYLTMETDLQDPQEVLGTLRPIRGSITTCGLIAKALDDQRYLKISVETAPLEAPQGTLFA